MSTFKLSNEKAVFKAHVYKIQKGIIGICDQHSTHFWCENTFPRSISEKLSPSPLGIRVTR